MPKSDRGGKRGKLDTLDGPRGGSGNAEVKWDQPNTPQMRPPAPTIRGQIGEKGKPISAVEATNVVNPYRVEEYGDYSMNCQRCVVAFELNRRGYNVEAEATWENDPYPRGNHWATAFNGGKLIRVGANSTANVNKNILDQMKKFGEGSRAIVRVEYSETKGHVFNVEYHRGKLYYYDPQVKARYENNTVFDHVQRNSVKIMRSDNLDIADNVRDMVRKREKK